MVVIREDENPDPRYAERFYLVAEVLSDSDKDIIDGKRDIYRAHPPAGASCWSVRIARKSSWTADPMAGARRCCRAGTNLPCRILDCNCPVRDVYRDTPFG